MSDEIMVSVICMAYNQKDYIKDALDSFLMQKTNFPFEVIVHDDASTDGTTEIIHEYETKFPDVFKPIYERENQYSKHKPIYDYCLEKAEGKYIASCEGDDYWTDPLKLQKQFDAMEAHPEIDMCAHASIAVKADTKKKCKKISARSEDCIIPVEDVIYGGGNFVSTNSLLSRKNFAILDVVELYPYDYSVQICGSLRGGMLYLSDCMSAYRVMAKGSWTEKISGDISIHRKILDREKEMLLLLNKETNGKYEAVIQKKILCNEFVLLCREQKWLEVFSPKYKEYVAELPVKYRLQKPYKLLKSFFKNIRTL